jgi:hypothetical protein
MPTLIVSSAARASGSHPVIAIMLAAVNCLSTCLRFIVEILVPLRWMDGRRGLS